MKYWQKIFLSTLLLFLTALNVGAYLVSMAAYKTSLESERERSFSEHGFISGAMNDDIEAITAREETPDSAVWESLFQRYARYYASQGIMLAMKDPNGKLYSNIPTIGTAPDLSDDGAKTSAIAELNGSPTLFVNGGIGSSGYSLITARSAADMQLRADDLTRTLCIGSALMAAVLALALYMILKSLTHPIKKLAEAATAMAAGDYGVRAAIRGRDEIAELAARFFNMAQTIEAQITELKCEAENKQRFIDGLAHEMRTPLAAIGGYAQYLCDAAVNEEDRLSACAYISRQSACLADLSEKLLMLTKLRTAAPVIEMVSLKKLFDDVKKTFPSCRALLRFRAGRVVWQTDSTLLSMLLINLVNNATHACQKGCTVSVTAQDRRIVVQDNGCGISEESLIHLTEPFYRADASRSRRGGGAGLGLSICESICQCLGYSMKIESEDGKGTKVTVLQIDNIAEINL